MFFHKKKQPEDTAQEQSLTLSDENTPDASSSPADQDHADKSEAATDFEQPAVNEEVDLPTGEVEKALDAELDRELKADAKAEPAASDAQSESSEVKTADEHSESSDTKTTDAQSESSETPEASAEPVSANTDNGTSDQPLYDGTVAGTSDTSGYQEPEEQPDEAKTKKKKKHTGLKVLLVLVIIAAAVYGCGVYIFQNRFLPRTELNGIDIGMKTIAETNQVAENSVASRSFKLTFRDGQTETIKGSDVGLKYEATPELEQMLANQNKWFWFKGFLGDADYLNGTQTVSCDESLLSEVLEALPEMNEENVTLPVNAKMVIGDDSLIAIEPEVEGDELNKDNVIQNVYDELQAGNYNIDLTKDEDNYVHPTVRADDEDLVSAKDDLNQLLQTTVTLDLYDGSTAQVDASVMKDWLSYDDSTGMYSIDDDTIEEKAGEWISDLADEKDDVEKTFEFQSTDSGTVEVDCSSYGPGYGHKLDQDAETEALVSDLENHNSEEHEAQYSVNQSAEDKVGDTYIELSLDEQHLWYYVDGELSMESDVVTGMRDDPKKQTPKGLFQIEYKERNRVLVGEHESYHTPVAYWMRFRAGGFGFHDATWQPYFGGDRWVNHGSHGCCNLPLDFAADLYNATDVGTPVVIYGTVY